MTDEPSTTVNQPAYDTYQAQVELERWSSNVGASRALRQGWEKGAGNQLVDRLVSLYLKEVRAIYEKSKHMPGRQQHIWDMMHGKDAVDHVAIESLIYVFGNMQDEVKYNSLALALGRRAEYVLWLTHPHWRGSRHLEGLKLASGNDLGMSKIMSRLRDAGFKQAASYRQLRGVERAALGSFFIEVIAASTGMIEVSLAKSRTRRWKVVNATDEYWKFQARWKEALALHSTVRVPMISPPRPWSTFDDGGYYTSRTNLSTVPWERWPETSKALQPSVLGSINLLQSIPHQFDHAQMQFEQALWKAGHALGKLPSQSRLPRPVDQEYKRRGLGPRAYWQAEWAWKADRRRNAARIGFVHGTIAYERIEGATQIWWPWHMDHRGRLYARGGHLNPQASDHHRSLIQFAEQSPVAGNEAQFAWSLGEAHGLQPDWGARKNYLLKMSHIISRIGEEPLAHLSYISAAKEPFRFVQLCRDWHGFIKDPSYTSGTIHWLDQTCSGWGHVACLIGDDALARFTNVTGGHRADLYAGLGRLIKSRIKWRSEHEEEERKSKCLRWLAGHEFPRSLWKTALMPVIYGQSFETLRGKIAVYLRDEVEDFLTEEGLRIIDLAYVMASTINEVIKEALPHAGDLSRWLSQVAAIQIEAGQRPYWFTPNGLAVESFVTETSHQTLTMNLAGRRVFISMNEATNKVNKAKTSRKLVPDFVHSQDAAFLQRFVNHWGTYKHPISCVHDCFGTTLGNAATMRRELNDQWARFYSVDYLERHRLMVAEVTGRAVPAAPMVGTLDRQAVGENPFLFC
jgi:DNA-directed RNA polymerase